MRSAHNHFNVSLRLMQKSSRFQRALPRADDRDSLPSKFANIPPFVAMNCLLRRKTLKYRGLFLKWTNSRSDHHIRRANLLAILQSEPEPRQVTVDTQNRPLVQIRT